LCEDALFEFLSKSIVIVRRLNLEQKVQRLLSRKRKNDSILTFSPSQSNTSFLQKPPLQTISLSPSTQAKAKQVQVG
jgi:hypothetical protein